MKEVIIRSSITLTPIARTVAFVISLLERHWSRDVQKQIIRTVAAHYGMVAQ
jgi:hypothetical protein